jgi:hypothetical protein
LHLMSRFLMLVVLSLLLVGCGSYASQAEKYSTEAKSDVAGSAYVLERFGAGEVSAAFVKASLQQYATAMKSTAQSLRSLKPPPDARTRQERSVEALDRAQRLVQKAGQKGVTRGEAPQLARRLREFGEGLVKP